MNKDFFNSLKEYAMLIVAGISIVTVIVTLASVDVGQTQQLKANTEAILKNSIMIETLSEKKLDKEEYFRFEQVKSDKIRDMQKQINDVQSRFFAR